MTEMDELKPIKGDGFEKETGGFASIFVGENSFTADEVRAALSPAGVTEAKPKVSVKPLEWPNSIHRGQRVKSSGGLLSYTIAHYGGSEPQSGVVYRWAIEGGGWSEAFFAYEHAIRAAQADYEQRILSTLTLSPAVVTEEQVDAAAKRIFEHWQFTKPIPAIPSDGVPAWVEGGNSLMHAPPSKPPSRPSPPLPQMGGRISARTERARSPLVRRGMRDAYR